MTTRQQQEKQPIEHAPPESVAATASTADASVSASASAARGTLITLFLKLFSFGCTQIVIRFLDPSKLGQAHVQLELLLTTILFISREGFRLALTTSSTTTATEQQQYSSSWSVAWLTIPFVTIISGIVLVFHSVYTSSGIDGDDASSSESASSSRRDYQIAGVLMIVSSWIEACGEPPVLYFLCKLQVHVRVAGETIATLLKTITTVVLFHVLSLYEQRYKDDDNINKSNQWQVTVLGLAQLVYAITYTVYMYRQANKLGGIEWKQHIPGSSTMLSTKTLPSVTTKRYWDELDRGTLWMVIIFTLQGFFKHLLTEADRIVLSTVANNYDQGVYAMGSSYGSLAARILLQPLEENARLLWSRLATAAATDTTTTTRNDDNNVQSTKKVKGSNKTTDELKDSYTTLVKLVLYIGLVFSCIAVNYTSLLLNVLAGRTWGSNEEAGVVLSAFCVYTAFLAMNGMTEALVYGVANSTPSRNKNAATVQTGGGEMGRLSIVHTLTGVIFAVSSSVLVTRYGTVGLVGANCLAMSIRALYSISFAARFFEDRQSSGLKQQQQPKSKAASIIGLISSITPHPIVLMGFLFAFGATKWSLQPLVAQRYHLRLDIRNKEWLRLTSQHIAVGISCLVGIISMAAMFDRSFVRSLRGMINQRNSSSKRTHQD
jgi:oligosaccharide translocation protein RFT1